MAVRLWETLSGTRNCSAGCHVMACHVYNVHIMSNSQEGPREEVLFERNAKGFIADLDTDPRHHQDTSTYTMLISSQL